MIAATMTEHAPFRADHVGSLLRPPELKVARERRARGEISAQALSEIEDRLIRTAVKMQGGGRLTRNHRRRFSPAILVVGLSVRDRGRDPGAATASPAAGGCTGRRHRARLAAADPESHLQA